MVDLRAGAQLLMAGATGLSTAKTAAARASAAGSIIEGSAYVRALSDNPFQARLAQVIESQARVAATGTNVERSIRSAMEGASLVLASIRARGL